jgi:hypothetical protein
MIIIYCSHYKLVYHRKSFQQQDGTLIIPSRLQHKVYEVFD